MTPLIDRLSPRPAPQPMPSLPLRLWTDLTPVTRRQLAHCVSDLIRQFRAAEVTPGPEKPHESD